LTTTSLAADAKEAINSWPGTQSLLSMWFHEELVPAIEVVRAGRDVHTASTAYGRRSAATSRPATWRGIWTN
jgi:hypothetical protein